jgi:hypothetical protein
MVFRSGYGRESCTSASPVQASIESGPGSQSGQSASQAALATQPSGRRRRILRPRPNAQDKIRLDRG